MLESIPPETIQHILQYLNKKELMVVITVSKTMFMMAVELTRCSNHHPFTRRIRCKGCNKELCESCSEMYDAVCYHKHCEECASNVLQCFNCKGRLCLSAKCRYSRSHLCSSSACSRIICDACYYPIQHLTEPKCGMHMLRMATKDISCKKMYVEFCKNRRRA